MLPWIIIIAMLGLLLLFVEILMPGFGLFGILGTISLLGTLVAAFKLFGFMVFLVMLIAVVIAFFGMFAFAKKSGLFVWIEFDGIETMESKRVEYNTFCR